MGENSESWTVVVPVKGTSFAKSRMAPGLDVAERTRLTAAFALDTVGALTAAHRVGRVIVVTDAVGRLADRLRQAGAEIVDDPGTGLNAAIAAGIAAADAAKATAALLGDLPCLTATDVDTALAQAQRHPLALVPDAEGSGTTLITALPPHTLVPRYGAGSAARHEAVGHVRLDIPATSGLRTDVDTENDLAAAVARGVGRHTAAALAEAATDRTGPLPDDPR